MSSLKIDVAKAKQQQEKKKSYSCFKCQAPITFKQGEYKVGFGGKSVLKPYNMDGIIEHRCNGTGGNKYEARQRTQQQSKETSRERYLRWYWGYGPGFYHRKNEQRYSSSQYSQRREEAKQKYEEYKQKYKAATITHDEAMVILQISDDKLDTVKEAYRRLALKYHPDRNKAAEATAKFIKATEAYELLIA